MALCKLAKNEEALVKEVDNGIKNKFIFKWLDEVVVKDITASLADSNYRRMGFPGLYSALHCDP